MEATRAGAVSLSDAGQWDDRLVERLEDCQELRGVDEGTLKRLSARMHARTYHEGDLLVKEGEPGRNLFVLLSGKASVYSERSECTLASMHAGAVFGEIAVLFPGQPRTATVRAAGPLCKVAVLSCDDLEEVMKRDQGLLRSLQNRARLHLERDQEREAKGWDIVNVAPDHSLREFFPELSPEEGRWLDEHMSLLLSNSVAFRIPAGQRLLLAKDRAIFLLKGEADLFGVRQTKKGVSKGSVITHDSFPEYDYLQASTFISVILVPDAVYQCFILAGAGLDRLDRPATPAPIDCAIQPMGKTVVTTPPASCTAWPFTRLEPNQSKTDGKVRGIVDGVLDLSTCPGEVTDATLASIVRSRDQPIARIDLNGCWQVTDAALLCIATELGGTLNVLSISDCWRMTSDGLRSALPKMTHLKSLSAANLDAVDDTVLACLPRALEVVDVSYCGGIDDIGLLAASCPRLVRLVARRCKILACSKSLPETLLGLDVGESNTLGSATFGSMLEDARSLVSLSIDSCPGLSPSCLKTIASLESLERLSAINCPQLVNDISKEGLLKSLAGLGELNESHYSAAQKGPVPPAGRVSL